MVLVGTGAVDHQELVSLAEKHFSSLPVSPNPIPLGRLSHPKTEFIGSEVRVRNDELPTAHLAIAVEGVGWSSPDYFPMLVMQSIFGNWDRSLGSSSLLSSRLSHIISSNNLANSFMSFSTSYSDTGLWGIYLVSENLMNLDDLAHFTLREWTRMSIAPTEVEVERAKSQLKASMLLGLDGTTAIAEDIGRQLVTSGRRMTPKQIEFAIDTVTPAEIQRVAQKYLWDKDVRCTLSFLHQFFVDHFLADCPRCGRFDRWPPRLQSYSQRHVLYDLLMRRSAVYRRPTIKPDFVLRECAARTAEVQVSAQKRTDQMWIFPSPVTAAGIITSLFRTRVSGPRPKGGVSQKPPLATGSSELAAKTFTGHLPIYLSCTLSPVTRPPET